MSQRYAGLVRATVPNFPGLENVTEKRDSPLTSGAPAHRTQLTKTNDARLPSEMIRPQWDSALAQEVNGSLEADLRWLRPPWNFATSSTCIDVTPGAPESHSGSAQWLTRVRPIACHLGDRRSRATLRPRCAHAGPCDSFACTHTACLAIGVATRCR